MELLVLNEQFTAIKLLDTFESLLWVERYYSCGDFELYVPVSMQLFNLLREDYYLWLKEANNAMIIETKQIETDAEDGSKLVITGRGLESILERRVIMNQTILSGSFQDGIKKLLDENIISPVDANRRIDNFIFEASYDTRIINLTIDAQFHGENLYETIQVLCEMNNVGFRVYLNDNNQFVFQLYSGTDRSYDQNLNPYVVFSPTFDNLVNSNYLESKKTLKTFALVGGEGEGAERKMTTVAATSGAGSGMNRREIFVEAGGVSTNVDGEEISEEEYLAQLVQKGREKLAENVETKSFEGQCETTRLFVYGEDFFMGDIVQVANEYGIEARTRVVEFIRSHDTNGTDVYPTFDTVYEKGYTPVEWIESTGTQWVDAEIYPDPKTCVEVDFQFTENTAGQRLISSRGGFMYVIYINSGNKLCFIYREDSFTGTSTNISADTSRHVIKIDGYNKNVVVDGVVTNSLEGFIATTTSTQSLQIFKDSSAESYAKCKFYGLRCYVSTILVRDFIPAIDKNGIAALYDRVTGKFFYNKGTGNFIAGPVIS